MKTFTDLEQSKKLVKILPIESADMYYDVDSYGVRTTPEVLIASVVRKKDIPCWSLAALFNALPKIVNNETLFIAASAALWHISYKNICTAIEDNLIDACYEMILKLHEQKLL